MQSKLALTLSVAIVLLLAGVASAQWHVTYYSAPGCQPAYYGPVPTTVYYAPPVNYAVMPVYTTRYRPLLGGSITRVRYYYAPAVYAAPVHYCGY